jgi:hypothetical protein
VPILLGSQFGETEHILGQPRIVGLFFAAPAMLPDLIGFKLARVRTLWQYNKNGSARFITMLVGGEKR